jgi:hypothetical protein
MPEREEIVVKVIKVITSILGPQVMLQKSEMTEKTTLESLSFDGVDLSDLMEEFDVTDKSIAIKWKSIKDVVDHLAKKESEL